MMMIRIFYMFMNKDMYNLIICCKECENRVWCSVTIFLFQNDFMVVVMNGKKKKKKKNWY